MKIYSFIFSLGFLFSCPLLQAQSILPPPNDSLSEALQKVDQMPYFPGCEGFMDTAMKKACSDRNMLTFIYQNITYPKKAIKKGIEGMCIVQFIVEKDGSISTARLVRDIGGGCGEESLRVVNLMNEKGIRWIPGRMDGENVRVQFNLPIKFGLTD